MNDPAANVTQMLHAVSTGNRGELDALLSAIYNDLRRLAADQLRQERSDHTLQPTALVHEAYIKLVDQQSTDWRDRLHFFAVAARIIRRILVDHARSHQAAKRGGDWHRVPIEQVDKGTTDIDLLALDEVLAELDGIDSRQAQIVELRFFGGLTVPEVADFLAISPRSVDRDWRCAKAWLYCRLRDHGPETSHG